MAFTHSPANRLAPRDWFQLILQHEPSELATSDAVSRGLGRLGAHTVAIAAFDFSQAAGSLTARGGELVADTLNLGARHSGAVVILASAGIRVQEGVAALSQMTRIIAARQSLVAAGRPLIAVATDPTMGGISASVLASADIILAEPLARLALVGPRGAAAMGQPAHVDSAEQALSAGCVDQIVERQNLRATLMQIFALLLG